MSNSTINLEKKSTIDLSKDIIKSMSLILSWSGDADIDISALPLRKGSTKMRDEDFCYYHNTNIDGLTHSGDERTGGEGASETINVDIDKSAKIYDSILFVATIHDAKKLNLRFGNIDLNLQLLITDNKKINTNISEDYPDKYSMQIATLKFSDGKIDYTPLMEVETKELIDYLRMFNVNI